MKDATALILKAIEDAENIVPSGKDSLLGIAARALDPEATMSKAGLARVLGLSPSLLVPLLVTADLAGDTNSRKELGASLFARIPLRARPAPLTPRGQLTVAAWSLERLRPLADHLQGLLERALELCRGVLEQGQEADPLLIKEIREQALELQSIKLVPVQKGAKSKLGIADEEAIRRRAAQSLRAMVEGLEDGGKSPHLGPTVAGEVAASLCLGQGIEAGADFCADLAAYLDSLPPELAARRPGNGS
jgi:hypothetical protein